MVALTIRPVELNALIQESHPNMITVPSKEKQKNRFHNSVGVLQHKNMRFLIADSPTNSTVNNYIKQFTSNGVTDVVRICDAAYDDKLLIEAGLRVHEMKFPDGSGPPDIIIDRWIQLLRERLASNPSISIAVHCVAGLGRAPVLVALGLIEVGNMRNLDAIEKIRQVRRGSFSTKQIRFVDNYKKRRLSMDQTSVGKLFTRLFQRRSSGNLRNNEKTPPVSPSL